KSRREARGPRAGGNSCASRRVIACLERGDRLFGGLFDDLGERREVERGTVSLALADGVGQELLDELGLRTAVRHDRVRERRDRVRLGGLLRRVHDADPGVRLGGLDDRSRFLDVFEVRQLEVAGVVFNRGGTEAGSDQVGRGDVADRARGLGDGRGHTSVAFGTDAGFEADGGGVADFRLPVGADFRQVVGERVGVTGTVGTEDRGDLQVRELRLRVELGDLRVVPAGDRAEVDTGDDLAREVDLLHARDVEAEAGGREGPRDRDAAVAAGGLFGGHRSVGGAEFDRPVRDLFDAFAGADSGVFHRNAFFDFEAILP